MLYNLLISSVAILASAYILPGVHVAGFISALFTAAVLGLVNIFIKPIISLLAFPITLITLGLFTFVINGLMILIAAGIVPGFRVDSLKAAILFSIVMCAVNLVLHIFF